MEIFAVASFILKAPVHSTSNYYVYLLVHIYLIVPHTGNIILLYIYR